MAMKEASKRVFNFVRESAGDDITLNGIAASLEMDPKSVNGCLVGMQKKGLIIREPVIQMGSDGKEQTVKYIRLTELGSAFNPDAE